MVSWSQGAVSTCFKGILTCALFLKSRDFRDIKNYIRERFNKEGGKLTTTGNMGQNIFCSSFCGFAHFSKFSMYAWGKKGKMLVFTGVYVCVKAKLTFVSFFLLFLHLPLTVSVFQRHIHSRSTFFHFGRIMLPA